MEGNINSRKDTFSGTDALKFFGGEKLPATTGTFLQRRTQYFNETRTLLGALVSHTGVVIQFDNAAK